MKKSFLLVLVSFFIFNAFSQNYFSAPIVQDIHAQVAKGRKINIYWTLPEKTESEITKVLLYRTTQPVLVYSQLAYEIPIAELDKETSGYMDTLNDYNDYFYTVILVTDKPYDLIFVSMNTTANGVHLNQPSAAPVEQKKKADNKLYLNGTLRETPLPYLDYIEGMNKDNQISEKTVNSTKRFSYKNKEKFVSSVNPYFFEEDLVSPDGGDDYILFEVLKNTFVQEKYDEAIFQLKKITGAKLNEDVQNRAYFYMAEAQYFTGDYEESVKTFVKVAHVFPSQSKEWINKVLDTLSIPQ